MKPKTWTLVILLIGLSLLSSCATTSNAYLPDLPSLENVPKGKPSSEREAILERNYIKLAQWIEIVWRGNS